MRIPFETLKKMLPFEKYKSWRIDYQLSDAAIARKVGTHSTYIVELRKYYEQQHDYKFPKVMR